MNLELLDPFAKTVPDHKDSTLSYGVEDATICRFDKRGTYLAVGYATGVVVIWDFVTRGIGRLIEAHSRSISALSWAKGGRCLLTASDDGRLHLWSLWQSTPELVRAVCLESPISSAMVYPGDATRGLALTSDGIVHVVRMEECRGEATSSPFVSTAVENWPHDENATSNASSKASAPKRSRTTKESTMASDTHKGAAAPKARTTFLCMEVDRREPAVCLGTSEGDVIKVDPRTEKVLASYTVAGCSKVKQMDLSRDGYWMLVHGGERVIRLLERRSTSGRSTRDFQDVVNRTRWQCCRFTGDSEYVAGGSRAEANCNIYLWTVGGHLVTRLEGPQMGLINLARHPVRPFLAAALTDGKVQLWGTTHTANWTAFAADFEELEENVEYVEREDEFDIVVNTPNSCDGCTKQQGPEGEEEDEIEVSVDAIHAVGTWSSDSDEGDEPFYLSTEPGVAIREGWYDLKTQVSKTGEGAPKSAKAIKDEGHA